MARTRNVTAQQSATPGIRIEYVRLDEVARWARNAKLHDKPGIRASLIRFGWVDPVIEDANTKRLVAGHGRLEVALELYAKGAEVPRGVRVDPRDGMWCIPVLRGISFVNEHEAEAYLIANNRLVENGGYDENILREILDDHREDLSGIGYTAKELDDLFAEVASEAEKPGVSREDGSDELPGSNGFNYQSQYGVIVMCDGELNQKLTYERLVEMGFTCKVVVV